MRRALIPALITGVLIFATSASDATAAGWGPRLGLTIDPDQVHFGAHVDAGYLADNFRFQPNFEMGIGDNLTVGAFNFDLLYLFGTRWDAWSPYLGGGPGLSFVDRDNRRDNNDLEAGLNIVGGIEKGISSGGRFLTEIRFGLIDTPEMKWTVGWTFRH